ncbi:asparagine synthase-related protein [Paenibacillus roseipurpureus]|uniref:asparagine synthase (glutamine-hydrolyzing) n=1 Tax=Paenibacillus roseopurpureus TaxID=2918901 RepID=A0AA96LVZ8_9BACL|nr:asparagine synthase-related protein [Paenibacillus sp. MBLB1832]WNR47143.1 asparagine synthase-related protein [Paenibacillus sp. MBLB1832]
MSAITGIFQMKDAPVSIEHGALLMKALEKFPSDDSRAWCDDHVFLGCHAQWITPESVGEIVPFYDHERGLAITSDVILDNRDELFNQLQVERGRRSGMTDSELLLLAYRKWGGETPKHLIGDYAFMIWDQRNALLFGARDFTGSRTLYYHQNQDYFTFCTTIEPLLTLPYIERKLNEDWLAEYLAIPNIIDTVDVMSSVYKEIKQIPPAHSILVANGSITLTKYNSFTNEKPLQLKSNEEYEEAFRDVFRSAVTARLRTHHNVGSQLSGGLDSGSVVSFAAKALQKQNKTLYTYSSVPEDSFTDWTRKYRVANERPYIQSTIHHVGNISDQYLDFPGKSALSELDEWLDIMEMPYKFFENSVWIKGIYERAREQNIGILLSGARGNFTVSWGPAMGYYASLMRKLNWIHLYDEVSKYSENIGVGRARILKVTAQKAFPGLQRLFTNSNLVEQETLPVLISPEFARRTGVMDKLKSQGLSTGTLESRNVHEERVKHFQQLNLWSTSTTSSSKLALRYKIHGRDPTNDLRVVRFCLSLPLEQFVQKGYDRSIIRRSMKHHLPDNIRLNQRTRGVQGADVIHRMRPSWRAFIEEIQQLSHDPLASEVLNVPLLQNALSKYQEPKADYAFDADFKILMRSLIVYRFLRKLS